MTSTVLVTGGAGFIGSHIVDALVERGHRVVVIDDLSTGDVGNLNSEACFYEGDVGAVSHTVLKREKPDCVIHHAAQINVRYSVENPVHDAQQNIVGSLSLLEACRQVGVRRFVFASSGGTVYGRASKLPATEDTPFAPLSPYGIAKASLEYYLAFYAEAFALDYVALRYANVFGPRQNPKGEAGVISIFLECMIQGRQPCIWGDGTQTRDFVYVSDVAKANVAAMQYAGTHRCFNIGTGKGTSVLGLLSALNGMGDLAEPTFNPDFREAVMHSCLDPGLARKELQWEIEVSLEDGIRQTLNWFRSAHEPGGEQ